MNNLVEKIRKATSDLAGESGDIGSENALNTLSLRLQQDINHFQSKFKDNLDDLRLREDLVINILKA